MAGHHGLPAGAQLFTKGTGTVSPGSSTLGAVWDGPPTHTPFQLPETVSTQTARRENNSGPQDQGPCVLGCTQGSSLFIPSC